MDGHRVPSVQPKPVDESSLSTKAKSSTIPAVKPEYASTYLIGDFIPGADPERNRAKPFWSWTSQRQVLLWGACAAAALTLIANMVITVVFYYGFDEVAVPGSDPALYRGDCTYASRLGSGLHVLINVLSTILLGASNLCMQLLLAPSRDQINQAHARRRWLEIGIPSYHNFRHMGLLNKLTWILLALSSLPLHFLYNSAVYNTIPAWQKEIFVGTSALPTNGTCDPQATSQLIAERSNREVYSMTQAMGRWPTQMGYSKVGRNGDFSSWMTEEDCKTRQQLISQDFEGYPQMVSAIDCLTRYSRPFNNQTFVVMISKYDLLEQETLSNESNSLLFFGDANIKEVTGFDQPSWLCGKTNMFDCRRPELWQRNQSLVVDWNILMYKIDSCLIWEHSLDNMCSVRYSLVILIVVCVANLLKVIGIAIAVWVCFYEGKGEPNKLPLATLGDALESFLSDPDSTTTGRCLYEKKDLVKKENDFWVASPQPRKWHSAERRRYPSASMITSFDTVKQRAGEYNYVYNMKWGAADQNALGLLNMNIDRPSSQLRLAITFFANMWQWAASVLYIQNNALLTCLCVEAEWQGYGRKRKALRVTSPKGLQRSTYFVSLPARYGLTLQVIFAFWHWTLSQSAFLVVVEGFWYLPGWNTYGEAKPDPLVPDDLPFLAFSPWPAITSVIIGVGIPIFIAVASFKKEASVLPAGGICSAVISGACHRPEDDKEAHLFPVTWGEVPGMESLMSVGISTGTPPASAPAASKWAGLKSIRTILSFSPTRSLRSRRSGGGEHSALMAAATLDTSDDQQHLSSQTKQTPTRTRTDSTPNATLEMVGHCCFTTSALVRRPTNDRRYM